jgi:hypothetical protein
VQYVITVYLKATYIALPKMPENFESNCTFKESRVIFTVILQFQPFSLYLVCLKISFSCISEVGWAGLWSRQLIAIWQVAALFQCLKRETHFFEIQEARWDWRLLCSLYLKQNVRRNLQRLNIQLHPEVFVLLGS